MRGPVPKRSEERRRRNKDPEGSVELIKVDLDDLIAGEVEIPQPPLRYHEVDSETGEIRELEEPEWYWEPITMSMWESFSRSGQAIFYEPSDWATAYMLMEVLDRWLKPQDVKVGQIGSSKDESGGGDITYVFEQKIVAMPGGVLTSILKGLASLMVTEGDRRRLRIELDRKKAQDAILGGENVVSIVSKREDLFKSASKG
jgi:hypothetical protein